LWWDREVREHLDRKIEVKIDSTRIINMEGGLLGLRQGLGISLVMINDNMTCFAIRKWMVCDNSQWSVSD